jgi:hypothetical protein
MKLLLLAAFIALTLALDAAQFLADNQIELTHNDRLFQYVYLDDADQVLGYIDGYCPNELSTESYHVTQREVARRFPNRMTTTEEASKVVMRCVINQIIVDVDEPAKQVEIEHQVVLKLLQHAKRRSKYFFAKWAASIKKSAITCSPSMEAELRIEVTCPVDVATIELYQKLGFLAEDNVEPLQACSSHALTSSMGLQKQLVHWQRSGSADIIGSKECIDRISMTATKPALPRSWKSLNEWIRYTRKYAQPRFSRPPIYDLRELLMPGMVDSATQTFDYAGALDVDGDSETAHEAMQRCLREKRFGEAIPITTAAAILVTTGMCYLQFHQYLAESTSFM